MKRFLLGVFVFASLMATSCSKDDDNPTGNNNNNNNNGGSGKMAASINGTSWNAMVAEAYIDRDEEDIVLYGINVTDLNAKNAKTIQILLENYHGTGTYTLTDIDDDAYMLEVVNGNVTSFGLDTGDNGVGGEVVITEATNSKVKGTFRFNTAAIMGDQKRVITNGSFELPLLDD